MPADPDVIFATLKAALAKHAPGLTATADTPTEYTLSSNSPSPFHQHKGHPLQFASVRTGKAYVS
ncbi:MAG TPA: hypothetical protein VER03_14920, partial [Bryobacteraceae bacterium]|nr:hypothetical protein [Bryobacteraceae bacterium]